MASDHSPRLIALGASNLALGLHALVDAARQNWGEGIDVVTALGLGRSYGMSSRVLGRGLPGILQCGLWRQLEASPAPTHALITDVGNDVLYGAPPSEILGWLDECVNRLLRVTASVVLTDLPMTSIRALSAARYLLFRSFVVPSCRLSLARARDAAEAVNEGLGALAERKRIAFFRLRPEWYGLDPIHIRPRFWRPAWREILAIGGEARSGSPRLTRRQAVRLFLAAPERRSWFGIERTHTPFARLGHTRLWMY